MNCCGCQGACCQEAITKSDAQNVVIQLLERRWIRLHDTADGSCSELKNGRCAIYERRPLICRAYPAGGPDCQAVIAKRRTRKQYDATIREAGDPTWDRLSPAVVLPGVATPTRATVARSTHATVS